MAEEVVVLYLDLLPQTPQKQAVLVAVEEL